MVFLYLPLQILAEFFFPHSFEQTVEFPLLIHFCKAGSGPNFPGCRFPVIMPVVFQVSPCHLILEGLLYALYAVVAHEPADELQCYPSELSR